MSTFNYKKYFILKPILLVFSLSATASQPVINVGVIRSGTPPFVILNQDDGKGIMIDIFEIVMNDLDYEIKLTPIPRNRIDRAVIDGDVDVFATAENWVDNPSNYYFTATIIKIHDVLWFLSDKSFNYQAPLDLFGKIIAFHRGYHYTSIDSYLQDNSIHHVEVSSNLHVFRMILKNRVDAGIVSLKTGQWLIKKFNLNNNLTYAEYPINSTSYKFAFNKSKKFKALAKLFNKKLKEIISKNKIDSITNKYM